MLPFATTKVGSGEKTKAYVIRQNVCLKLILFSVITGSALLMLLSLTMYDVHIERRYRARSAGVHRREEHNLRLQLSQVVMRLQRHLKDDVGDMSKLRSYRANMFRMIGEYGNVLRKTVIDKYGPNATEVLGLYQMEVDFTQNMEGALAHLWNDVNTEGGRAKANLHNITHELLLDLQLDQAERKQFEDELDEYPEYRSDAEAGYRTVRAPPAGAGGVTFRPSLTRCRSAPQGDYESEVADEDEKDFEEERMKETLDRFYHRLVALVCAKA